MNRLSRQLGFSLIELVLVIVIVAILAGMSTKIITLPVNSYLDASRRTTLADAAEITLRRMQRDVRRALPNSLRISTDGQSVELLHTVDGGRYRARRDPNITAPAGKCTGDPDEDVLDFTKLDDCFEIMGTLNSFNPLATAGELVVVYNIGVAPASAYAAGNSSVVQNATNAAVLKFASMQFPYSSPQQRFFIVDTPVTYRCDIANQQLLRYSGYSVVAAQSNVPVGATGQIQVNNVTACSFVYTAGVASRAAQLSVSVTLTNSAGESIVVVKQIHVDNVS